MPSITINEIDSTSTLTNESLESAVYVSGFSLAAVNPDAGSSDFNATTREASGYSTGVPVHTPVLCTSLADFHRYFGSSAPVFVKAQAYPEAAASASGFASIAVPNEEMFIATASDPGYLYASELLSAGIPVVYERMNKWNTYTLDESGNPITKITITQTIPTVSTVGTVGSYLLYTVETPAHQDLYVCTNVIKRTSGTEITYEYEWAIAEASCSYNITGSTTEISLDYDVTVKTMYDGLVSRFVTSSSTSALDITDKSIFSLKFITSGGYPTFEFCRTTAEADYNYLAKGMIAVAEERGDCVALIDHTNSKYRSLVGDTSVFGSINGDYALSSSFAAMFTPWVKLNSTYVIGAASPSLAYLITYTASVKAGNAEWLAVAGVSRGAVSAITALNTPNVMTQAIAESYSTTNGVSINPILNLGSYGFVIWGNRTLKLNSDNTSATSYLNLRILVNSLKRSIYIDSLEHTFEQNSDILWINFKAYLTAVLDEMVSTYGIKEYSITKAASNDRAKIAALITLVPIYAVETFEVTVYLTDDEISTEEA